MTATMKQCCLPMNIEEHSTESMFLGERGENMIGYYLSGAAAGLVLVIGTEIVLTAIEEG